MYEIVREKLMVENVLAGDFPIIVETQKVKASIPIAKHKVVSLKGTGIEATTASNIADIYGITAEAAEGGEDVTVYITGEFFADALSYESGAEAAAVKLPLRKLGIFLK